MFYHLHFFHIIAILLKLQLKVSLTGLKLTLAVFMALFASTRRHDIFQSLVKSIAKIFCKLRAMVFLRTGTLYCSLNNFPITFLAQLVSFSP